MKQKKVKPPVDYRSVKSGFVDKQGEVYRSRNFNTHRYMHFSFFLPSPLSIPLSFPSLFPLGNLFKKWNHQWMTLDEDGAVLRWYKTDKRTGSDGQLFMK